MRLYHLLALSPPFAYEIGRPPMTGMQLFTLLCLSPTFEYRTGTTASIPWPSGMLMVIT